MGGRWGRVQGRGRGRGLGGRRDQGGLGPDPDLGLDLGLDLGVGVQPRRGLCRPAQGQSEERGRDCKCSAVLILFILCGN